MTKSIFVALLLALAGCTQLALADVIQTTTTYPDGSRATTTEQTTEVTGDAATTTEKTTVVGDSTTTTTTTEKTTVVSSAIDLPLTNTYIVVDPVSGVLPGVFDVRTHLLDGRALTPGLVIVEKTTGQVFATVDSSGNLVAMTTLPAVTPQRFAIVDGKMVFFSDDILMRRAALAQRINNLYAAGKLSHDQVRRLRENLNDISRLSNKFDRNGDLSNSTRRRIEDKFASTNNRLERNLADISSRRARIGLVVD